MPLRFLILAVLALASCKSTPPPPQIDPQAKVAFLTPQDGEVAPQLAKRLAEVKDRKLLVYASAPWCEPCRRFHEAVDRGDLTGKLGNVDLMAFDAEYDAERLLMSGYEQRMIPAFHLPGPDGRSVNRHIEGGVSGEGAVGDLVPRILSLLGPPPG